MKLTLADILNWLCETDARRLRELWERADRVRREHVGNAVHLRGLIEISSFCDRSCLYCGLRMPNREVLRYRMSAEEILQAARAAGERGYGTIVLQAGEDPGLDIDALGQVIARVKRESALAITLSLGERSEEELRALKNAGADRYLLRFETSHASLFDQIHPLKPAEPPGQRWALLSCLRELGFELGSGVMIGLPGQRLEDLAWDVEWFRRWDLDMIGVGPFIADPQTPLGAMPLSNRAENALQVQGDEVTTCKVIALARLVCPRANIPSTTALATINPERGQRLGLERGANVMMPNFTPAKYRRAYAIYPQKAGSRCTVEESDRSARDCLAALGRPVASGRGDSPAMERRRATSSRTLEASYRAE